MAERPDLIILGGDYVTWGGDGDHDGDREFVEPAADALKSLSAPHGVFGVLGNHDDDRDMPAAMVARNVEMLKDARTRLTINGETLDLIGIRYWTTRARDISIVARGAAAASILLGAQSVAPERGGRARHPSHAERTHARRPDRPSGHRGDRRA